MQLCRDWKLFRNTRKLHETETINLILWLSAEASFDKEKPDHHEWYVRIMKNMERLIDMKKVAAG